MLEEPANSVFYTEQGVKEVPQNCRHLFDCEESLSQKAHFNGVC